MNNQLKSKTRLTYIQIIFQHLSTNSNIEEILNSFEQNYKGKFIENFNDKNKIKFEFNSRYLIKLINFYILFIKSENYISKINKHIDFDRKFDKWDLINKSILIAALSEIKYTNTSKFKIVLNDYLNISKSFINKFEIGIINAILDKLIHDQEA